MEPLLPWELANTVTGFATCLAGLMMLALTWLMGPQPARWWAVYVSVVVTGVFTVTYHGLGETHGWKVLDNGSNLVVTAVMTAAVLGDFRPGRVARAGTAVSWAVNAVVIALMWWVPSTTDVSQTVTFGGWGGYMVGELVLIANAFAVLGLFVAHRAQLPADARPVLSLTAALFVVGAALSTANGDEIVGALVPLHALWHIVGAFGFIALWAFNHKRFGERGALA
jgi:hypothetical protein